MDNIRKYPDTNERCRRPHTGESDPLIAATSGAQPCKITTPWLRLRTLAEILPDEDWGVGLLTLAHYVHVHIDLALRQGRYIVSHDGRYVRAGRLFSRDGKPVYAKLVHRREGAGRWIVTYVGVDPYLRKLPTAPALPSWPTLDEHPRIEFSEKHIFLDNGNRLGCIRDVPRFTVMHALDGAIRWSLNRRLAARELYRGRPAYVVPLYLNNPANTSAAPDLVAPVVPGNGEVRVPTILRPEIPYAYVRVVVATRDDLPDWLTEAWRRRGNGADARHRQQAVGRRAAYGRVSFFERVRRALRRRSS